MSIVGWYHTHPTFGIFLSDRDRFIQEHFFSGPGQIAYVVDPVNKTEGVFFWREGKPQPCPHYWVGDRIEVGAPATETAPKPATGAEPRPADNRPAPPAQGERSSWLGLVAQVALYVLVFIAGFILAGKLTDLDRLRIEQGALARSLVYFKIRLGLREDLGQVDSELQAATQAAKGLAQEHLKLLPEPKETQVRWAEVLQQLDRSSRRLGQIGATYSPTPQEMALLMSLMESRSKPAAGDKPDAKDEKADSPKGDKPSDGKSGEKKP
jgi:hypothetical protein